MTVGHGHDNRDCCSRFVSSVLRPASEPDALTVIFVLPSEYILLHISFV